MKSNKKILGLSLLLMIASVDSYALSLSKSKAANNVSEVNKRKKEEAIAKKKAAAAAAAAKKRQIKEAKNSKGSSAIVSNPSSTDTSEDLSNLKTLVKEAENAAKKVEVSKDKANLQYSLMLKDKVKKNIEKNLEKIKSQVENTVKYYNDVEKAVDEAENLVNKIGATSYTDRDKARAALENAKTAKEIADKTLDKASTYLTEVMNRKNPAPTENNEPEEEFTKTEKTAIANAEAAAKYAEASSEQAKKALEELKKLESNIENPQSRIKIKIVAVSDNKMTITEIKNKALEVKSHWEASNKSSLTATTEAGKANGKADAFKERATAAATLAKGYADEARIIGDKYLNGKGGAAVASEQAEEENSKEPTTPGGKLQGAFDRIRDLRQNNQDYASAAQENARLTETSATAVKNIVDKMDEVYTKMSLEELEKLVSRYKNNSKSAREKSDDAQKTGQLAIENANNVPQNNKAQAAKSNAETAMKNASSGASRAEQIFMNVSNFYKLKLVAKPSKDVPENAWDLQGGKKVAPIVNGERLKDIASQADQPANKSPKEIINPADVKTIPSPVIGVQLKNVAPKVNPPAEESPKPTTTPKDVQRISPTLNNTNLNKLNVAPKQVQGVR